MERVTITANITLVVLMTAMIVCVAVLMPALTVYVPQVVLLPNTGTLLATLRVTTQPVAGIMECADIVILHVL